ncbi:MAG: hypothetical protein DVB31_07620 [Verrucomicrobia bacterium]|nr:MAG: hypothetical protein DVB31_07620 [Verrucomicrobiota bacterium]
MKRILGGVLAVLAILPARGHRLDECLQGSFVLVATHRVSVELNLTPGVAVADRILALADTDRDGAVSDAESMAFGRWVSGSLSLEIDGTRRPLGLVGAAFPAAMDLRSGTGTIQLEYATSPLELAVGRHRVRYGNRWEPVPSVYLANALMPAEHSIRVRAQHRDIRQSELDLELDVVRGANRRWWMPASVAFAVLGVGLLWWRRSGGRAAGSPAG